MNICDLVKLMDFYLANNSQAGKHFQCKVTEKSKLRERERDASRKGVVGSNMAVALPCP